MIIGISGKKRTGKDLVGRIIQYLTSTDIGSTALNRLVNNNPIEGHHMSEFKIVKYADKLKDIICPLTGCTREQLEDEKFKNTELGEEWWVYKIYTLTYNITRIFNNKSDAHTYCKRYNISKYTIIKFKPTYRYLLQNIGTDLFRNQLHPNIWVNATMSDYKDGSTIHIGGGKCISESEFRKDKFILANLKFTVDELLEANRVQSKWIITDVRFPNEVKAIEDRDGFVIRVNRALKHPSLDVNMQMVNEHESETALDNHKFEYIIDNNSTIEELIEQIRTILIKEKVI